MRPNEIEIAEQEVPPSDVLLVPARLVKGVKTLLEKVRLLDKSRRITIAETAPLGDVYRINLAAFVDTSVSVPEETSGDRALSSVDASKESAELAAVAAVAAVAATADAGPPRADLGSAVAAASDVAAAAAAAAKEEAQLACSNPQQESAAKMEKKKKEKPPSLSHGESLGAVMAVPIASSLATLLIATIAQVDSDGNSKGASKRNDGLDEELLKGLARCLLTTDLRWGGEIWRQRTPPFSP